MKEYCGCCGREARRGAGYDGMWCVLCKMHVLRFGHLEDRTYFAQTGKPCPFDCTQSAEAKP